MKRKGLPIRIWLPLAVTAATSLALASGASAMRNAADAGGATVTPHVSVGTSGGFDWGNVAIGAIVAVAVALLGFTLAYLARSRSRLAASH
jgi:hypothetical protein